MAKYRLFDQYHVIAVDASGVHHFEEQHCLKCSHKTSSKGKFRVTEEALVKLKNEGIPEHITKSLKSLMGKEMLGKARFTELMTDTLAECGQKNWAALLRGAAAFC